MDKKPLHAAYMREYYAANKERLSAIERQKRANLRSQVIELLGGVCRHCGFSDRRALQVDHIYGGGNREINSSRFKSGIAYYKKILKEHGVGYQLLCANCNWIKRHENDE